MAIGATASGGMLAGTMGKVVAGSVRGQWVTANDDCRATQVTTELYKPSSITDSTFKWVAVPEGATRVLLQAKVAKATTAVGTSPVVALVGGWITNGADMATASAALSAGTYTAGEIRFARLDAATLGATGLTLTFDATPAETDNLNDSMYYYSIMLPDVTSKIGYDICGASFIGVLVQTASATTASAAVIVDVLFLN